VAATNTRERILDEALTSFGTKGYDGTSLDALASLLGVTKQAILYHFASKEQLLEAVIDRSAAELAATLESALAAADGAGGGGWERIESIVRSVFRLAARRPELLGLLREVTRLGPPAATRLNDALDPLIGRAAGFLSAEMAAGTMRRQEPRLLLLSAYSSVIGAATEVEVLRALGYEPTTRSLVRRRAELLSFLRAALLAP
jgi:AcrR family transcriptional regulator